MSARALPARSATTSSVGMPVPRNTLSCAGRVCGCVSTLLVWMYGVFVDQLRVGWCLYFGAWVVALGAQENLLE